MIHFEGEQQFPLPKDEVAAKLSDAGFLVGCLSNVEQVVESTPDRAVWKLRPGFSFVRTTLDVTMEVVERKPGESARFRMTSKGIGASSTVEAALNFQSADSGTAVRWTADITELSGLLKMVPRGLIQSAASKVIAETWEAVGQKLRPA